MCRISGEDHGLISICAEDCRHSVAYVIMSKARTQKNSSSRGDIMNFLISPGPSARAAGALCKLHAQRSKSLNRSDNLVIPMS